MKIWVSGGSGYIGKNLMKHLGEHDNFNYDLSLGYDILNKNLVRRSMRGCDAAIHLAGVPHVAYCEKNIAKTLRIHVQGTENVAVAAEAYDIPLVLSSTIAAKTLHNVYGISKYLGELIVLRSHGVVLRFTNVYGGISDAAHNSAVIERFVAYKKGGDSAKIFGDGSAKRDFIHVDDVCQAIISALKAPSGIYEVGTGQQTSIKELADMIDVKYDLVSNRVGDITEIETIPDHRGLSWKPKVRLEDGIKEMLKRR